MFMILPLSMFEGLNNTITAIFIKLKGIAVGSAAGSTTAALTAASFIIAFQLIKLSYDIMSDEQQGGFGGIRLWQLLRPVVILVAISNMSFCFRVVDKSITWMCSQINSSVGVATADKWTKIAQETVRKHANNGTVQIDDKWRELNEAAKDGGNWAAVSGGLVSKDIISTLEKQYGTSSYNGYTVINNTSAAAQQAVLLQKALYATNQYELWNQQGKLDGETKSDYDAYVSAKSEEDRNAALMKMINRCDGLYNAAVSATSQADVERKIDEKGTIRAVFSMTWKELMSLLAGTVYDFMCVCVIAYADLQMMVLAVFFPWALVLSLISKYKDAFWSFVSSYLTASMTKVVANIINWGTLNCVSVISAFSITKYLPHFLGGEDTVGGMQYVTIAQALIYITGFIALTKCGSLVQMVLPGASTEAQEMGAGGLAVASMAKDAVKSGVQATGKGAGKIGAVASGNILGKVSGGTP